MNGLHKKFWEKFKLATSGLCFFRTCKMFVFTVFLCLCFHHYFHLLTASGTYLWSMESQIVPSCDNTNHYVLSTKIFLLHFNVMSLLSSIFHPSYWVRKSVLQQIDAVVCNSEIWWTSNYWLSDVANIKHKKALLMWLTLDTYVVTFKYWCG